jgi:hypothetical protein
MDRFLFANTLRIAPLSGCGRQARWLCCSLLTYRTEYVSSLAPRQQACVPAAECELIFARTLTQRPAEEQTAPGEPRTEAGQKHKISLPDPLFVVSL